MPNILWNTVPLIKQEARLFIDQEEQLVNFNSTLQAQLSSNKWVLSPSGNLLYGEEKGWHTERNGGPGHFWLWTSHYWSAIFNRKKVSQCSFRYFQENHLANISLYIIIWIIQQNMYGGNGCICFYLATAKYHTWATDYPIRSTTGQTCCLLLLFLNSQEAVPGTPKHNSPVTRLE